MNMRFTLLLLTALLTIASHIASAEVDWSKYDLPDLGPKKMWCMFTHYSVMNEDERIYLCSYECENGMILNTPGAGQCPQHQKEPRW